MQKIALETVNCLICGSEKYSVKYADVANRFNTEEKFQVVSCTNCGFTFLNPRPTEQAIGAYYDLEEYHPHNLSTESLTDRVYAKIRNINLKNKKKLIEKFAKTDGHLLDIGCGTGEFIEFMSNHDWQVTGMETADESRGAVRGSGFMVYPNLDEIQNEFDVITLWHVLEHVHRVEELMKNLSRLLKADGKIFVAVPNLLSADSHKYGQDWVALDAPRHLYHFRISDIRKLFEKNGYRIESISNKLIFDTWYNTLLSEQLKARIEKQGANYFSALLKAAAAFGSGMLDVNKFSSPVYVISRK